MLMAASAVKSGSQSLFGISPGGICEVVDCVRGTCRMQTDPPFYLCDCEAGWASPLNVSYVPCVAPDCAVYNACSETASPPSTVAFPPLDYTIHFNVCTYPVCGRGRCKSIETELLYECNCDQGYANFLNISTGYCVQECALGVDCMSDGVPAGGDDPQTSSGSYNETVSSEGGTRIRQNILILALFFTTTTSFGETLFL